MRTLRCKCGEQIMWTTDSPCDCEGCSKCNTTYAEHPDGHKELQPHEWKITYSQNTGKPYKICSKCHHVDAESRREADIFDEKGNVKGAKVYDKPAQLTPDPEPIVPTSTPVPSPSTLDDAIEILTDQLKLELEAIMALKENKFLTEAHHGLGRFLRNEWGLWTGSDIQKWFKDRGIHHADDMSSIILTSFHRKLHNVDIDLDNQIKHYIRYWNFHNPDVNKGKV